MKKIARLDYAIAIFYLIVLISLFLPYSRVTKMQTINDSNKKEVFIETSNYWYENPGLLIVLGFTVLIVATSFSEKSWINKIRSIVFSLFTIGILGLITVGTKLANQGPIPQMTIFYYVMIFAIFSILISANIKTWQKKS